MNEKYSSDEEICKRLTQAIICLVTIARGHTVPMPNTEVKLFSADGSWAYVRDVAGQMFNFYSQ